MLNDILKTIEQKSRNGYREYTKSVLENMIQNNSETNKRDVYELIKWNVFNHIPVLVFEDLYPNNTWVLEFDKYHKVFYESDYEVKDDIFFPIFDRWWKQHHSNVLD